MTKDRREGFHKRSLLVVVNKIEPRQHLSVWVWRHKIKKSKQPSIESQPWSQLKATATFSLHLLLVPNQQIKASQIIIMSQPLCCAIPMPATATTTKTTKEEHPDPRDRFVGRWVLATKTTNNPRTTRKAPWLAVDGVTNIDYNVDGDLILHTKVQVGIKPLGLTRWIDGGFAKVNEEGIFRCRHTPHNGYLQLHLFQEGDVVVADCQEYLHGQKKGKVVRWIRESKSVMY